MNMQPVYIIIALAALATVIVALLVVFVKGKRQENRLTPMTGLAFAFILAGIFSGVFFGAGRLINYGLMGIGVILAVVDTFVSKRKQVWNRHGN